MREWADVENSGRAYLKRILKQEYIITVTESYVSREEL